MDEKEFDINLDHAKAAYANAQEVIRFVDSKTGIMTGVLTVTTSIPLAVLHLILSGKSNEGATIYGWVNAGGIAKCLAEACAFFMLVGFALGVVSLVAATSGLMARRPRTSLFHDDSLLKEILRVIIKTITFGKKDNITREAKPEVSCLFPQFTPEQRCEAIEKFQRLKDGGYKGSDVLREYATQLESVGSILETKISRNRKAVQCFEGQVAAYALSTVLSAVLIFAYPPIQKPIPESWDPTLPGHAYINVNSGGGT